MLHADANGAYETILFDVSDGGFLGDKATSRGFVGSVDTTRLCSAKLLSHG